MAELPDVQVLLALSIKELVDKADAESDVDVKMAQLIAAGRLGGTLVDLLLGGASCG